MADEKTEQAGGNNLLLETALAGAKRVFANKAEIALEWPGRGDLFAATQLTPADAQRIFDEVARAGKTDAPFSVDVVDAAGDSVATVTMSVRKVG